MCWWQVPAGALWKLQLCEGFVRRQGLAVVWVGWLQVDLGHQVWCWHGCFPGLPPTVQRGGGESLTTNLQHYNCCQVEKGDSGFCLPYEMEKGKIRDPATGSTYSVKMQFNSEEQWTKAMKYMLTNLKWGLAWVTSKYSKQDWNGVRPNKNELNTIMQDICDLDLCR